MGDVKRYKCGFNPHDGAIMIEAHPTEPDLYRKDEDYARLSARCAELERERDEAVRDLAEWVKKTRAELTRLRAVEAAANAFLDAYESQPSPAVVYARLELAEACGRKG